MGHFSVPRGLGVHRSFDMGAGASFPATLNEEQAQQIAGERFDKKAFQRLAGKQGGLITGYQLQVKFTHIHDTPT